MSTREEKVLRVAEIISEYQKTGRNNYLTKSDIDMAAKEIVAALAAMNTSAPVEKWILFDESNVPVLDPFTSKKKAVERWVEHNNVVSHKSNQLTGGVYLLSGKDKAGNPVVGWAKRSDRTQVI